MASSSSNRLDALVVGGDSMVGGHLAAHLRARGLSVHASTRRPLANAADRPAIDLTADDWPELDRAEYGTAFLCAAQARLAACRQDPAGSARVNVRGAVGVARRLAARGTRVVFLSTNQVFDGQRAPRLAGEARCPVSEYGRQKAEAEAQILAFPGTAILRLTKIVHPGMALFDGWARDLAAGRPVMPFSDMGLAAVTVDLVVACLEGIMRQSAAAGIWQLSAPADVTYADAACGIATAIGADTALVQPVAGQASRLLGKDEAARWTALDSSRVATELGLAAPSALDAVMAVTALNIPASQGEHHV